MSGHLAPSKSTVYVSNLPFKLTNNDLHQIFSKYGEVVKVTVMKDKHTWKSKGVAFVLYMNGDGARRCVSALDNQELFGRTIKASIAKYNGRAPEFIRRKEYRDKSKCFECGETGHLSYFCPKNSFGDRDPPKKKEKQEKKKFKQPFEKKKPVKKQVEEEEVEEEEESDEGEDPALESLSAAIEYEQMKRELDQQKQDSGEGSKPKRQKFKQSSYFSDEEEVDDD